MSNAKTEKTSKTVLAAVLLASGLVGAFLLAAAKDTGKGKN
jgi:hypothetical protein